MGAGAPLTRRLAVVVAGVALLAALAVLAANLLVARGGADTIPAGAAARAPEAQVALVLGARVLPDGRLSRMLADRVAVGAELYRRGRVRRVLVSGDHGTRGYDEVNAMRRALVRAGVPDRHVFTDHAGFDTWDSVVRARRVFRVRSALIVSQGFHVGRAVWLAGRAGLPARGVAADLHRYGGQGTLSGVREVVARTKAAADGLLGTEPAFLGPPVPITGDARASRG